jgi:CheY-like chemotaxis protein
MYKSDTQLMMTDRTEMPSQRFNWYGKKILIVEDDYANYLFFHEILSCAHACLIRAVSLQEAFDILASSPPFDLAIINTGILDNDDCRSLKKIKNLWPLIRIIAITGGNCCGNNQKCDPSGCDTMISYNVDGIDVRLAVNDMLYPVN